MSIIQIMVTIIIVTILVTVILGVASYGAYWLRRGRRPATPLEVDTTPRFFYRYLPEDQGAAEDAAAGSDVEFESAEPEPVPELAAAPTDSGNGRSLR
jgi:Tfp pilus assembly protein PilE